MTSTPVDSPPPSPSRGVIALHASSDHDWEPILHSSNQVVLYNPKSHALSISHSSSNPAIRGKTCPFCKCILPKGFEPDTLGPNDFDEADPSRHSRKPDYFQLLSVANESATGPPPLTAHEADGRGGIRDEGASRAFPPNTMAEGYFKRFFQEEYKLGMGANGSVYLCQHMLDGNSLGHFAVKKIAVGESHTYLLNILREVRLLERLHHPNIITYHHAWLETCQFSSFGPQVPTLHVLMQWAEGGSLDDFIDIRLGRGSPHVHINPFGASSSPNPATSTVPPQTPLSRATANNFVPSGSDIHSRSARIRAFRAYQQATPEEKERMRRGTFVANGKGRSRRTRSLKAVHLLSADEVKSLFRDVVEGLNFLHSRSILHLDLKPGNVLLTWDEGQLIPRAMLSDFGTSRDMIASNSIRSGNTGTLEYSSPESLPSPQTGLLHEINSKSDMWSLGMILHKLLFFKLPYRYAADGDNDIPLSGAQPTERHSRLGEGEKLKRLEQEVLDYPGFKFDAGLVTTFEARRLSPNILFLLEGLLNKVPNMRPSCERISIAIKTGKLDPLKELPKQNSLSTLVPLARSVLGVNGWNSSPSSATEPEFEVEDLPPEHDEPAVSDVSNTDLNWTSNRKSTLLGLPSPADSSDSMHSHKNPTQARSLRDKWMRSVLEVLARHKELLARLVKSAVLVMKVLSISTMCPSSHGFPRIWIFSMLVGAALVDAVFDMRLSAHTAFLVFHVLVIKSGCTHGRCCV